MNPKNHGLPPYVRSIVNCIAESDLFDIEYFSRLSNNRFVNKEEAILYYLTDHKNWWHSTSPWLDVNFVMQQMASEAKIQNPISPLEWYLRQGISQDVGPNPLFSNADYQIQTGLKNDAKPNGSSFFDDWLVNARQFSGLSPSFFVDMPHVAGLKDEDAEYEPEVALTRLLDWLQTPPAMRSLSLLHPYFDEDWLSQCFILKNNRPKGCLLSAYRLGHLNGQSPLAILQHGNNEQNYYNSIRKYEIGCIKNRIDDITYINPDIDANIFYKYYPHQQDVGGSSRRSSLYCYITSPREKLHRSFIKKLDDEFVDNLYPGIVDYCIKARGIGDINYIWARWLNLLGIPSDYIIDRDAPSNRLTINELFQLRKYQNKTESGVSASFIVPTYGRDDLVLRCILSAIVSPGSSSVEFIIAEDAAHVDCSWILGYFIPFAKIIKNPENQGFLLNCNNAVNYTSGEIFVLVNNDIIVHANALNEMLLTFKQWSDVAVVGGLVLNVDGTIQENGGILWNDASAWNYHRNWSKHDEYLFNVREADYVSGCWIGIRRTVWDELGGFDISYTPAYCEDSDFCLKCWHGGYKVFVNPLSEVTHLEGATMGRDENSTTLKSYQKLNLVKMQEKWKYQLDALHNTSGNQTPFHTGRFNNKRFISIVFDHYLPEPDRDAGSRTIYSICETLANIKNNYVLFVPENNYRSKYAVALERMGIQVIIGSEAWKYLNNLIESYSEVVKYIFVSRIPVAKKYTWHLDHFNCHKSIYIHDIDVLREFPHQPSFPGYLSMVKDAMIRYAKANEEIFSHFDNIISCSEDETDLLKTQFGDKIIDMFPYNHQPLTVDKPIATRCDLVFVGSFNHPPNRQAIQYLVENLWPTVYKSLPGATLHICGSGTENARFIQGKNIIQHGHVTDQTLSFLYSIARLAVAPLITGAGIKGKVIEASAHGVACVGTDVAWQGLDMPNGCTYLSGSIETFAERLIQAYNAYDEDMLAALLDFYETCRGRNNICEVIPLLVAS